MNLANDHQSRRAALSRAVIMIMGGVSLSELQLY